MQNNASNQASKPALLVDQVAFNYSASQAATSHFGSISGAVRRRLGHEDSQSTVSLYTSYTAQSNDRIVRKEGGREFNTLSEVYPLPADDGDRLDKQHRAFSLSLGGLYPAPEVVRAALAPQAGVTKRILDIGCGSGIWCTEMAREFPHCQVLGIDLAPVPLDPEDLPPNCSFEMDDVNQGLDHLQGMYDLVHARAFAIGLKDFRTSLQQIVECLKPGGILIWMDGDYDFYSGWPMTYVPYWSSSNPHGSYTQRVLYEFRKSAILSGSDVRTMEKVLQEGFWNNAPMLDPGTCKTAGVYLPIGPWCEQGDPAQQEQLKYVGMLLRHMFFETSKATQPSIIKAGWSKQESDRWAARMREECQHGTMGFRMHLAWGRRRAGPNLPAPMLHTVPIDDEGKVKYPLFEVYDTPEEAAAAAELRRRGKDIPPPPSPWETT